MFRFTIREVVLLTLVVAMGNGVKSQLRPKVPIPRRPASPQRHEEVFALASP